MFDGARQFDGWGLRGRYVIEKQIGAGSYGSVVKARHAVTNQVVAIKRIVNVFADLIDAKRILREIALLKRLNHPNIVSLLEIIVPDNDFDRFTELFLVLEKAPLDLKKLLATNSLISLEQAVFIVYNVLLALKYMHSAGVWHRDLKPANILVFDNYRAKVCDFGLARTVEQPEPPAPAPPTPEKVLPAGPPGARPQLRKHSPIKPVLTSHVVTRWYRAPELILVEEDYNEKIDVWSLGCIFGELLQMVREVAGPGDSRRPMFPGRSCFPLSPDAGARVLKSGFRVDGADQLVVIVGKLGTPEPADLAFISDKQALAHINALPKTPRTRMADLFPRAPAEACAFLEGCLQFNPNRRFSVDECLAHPLFSSIRSPVQEKLAREKFDTELERETHIPLEELRRLFRQEVLAQSFL